MFQEPRLLPWARVLSNVEVGLGRDRAFAGCANCAPTRRLTEVGLDDKRGQWPAVLSGGQKQRVALARALVSHPRVLAFDEPLGALDALTRISMQRLLERVWHDQAFTAILVTHDVAEAVALADRVLVIEDGRIAHDIHVDTRAPAPARLGRSCGAGRRHPARAARSGGRSHQTCEAAMNSAVRHIRIDRDVSSGRFSRRHAPSGRRRQRDHGGAGQGRSPA